MWSKGKTIIDAHMGGHIGPQLKYAGYDGIVVKGVSSKPVYMRIEDDDVSLEDTSEIWDEGTFAANQWLNEQNGRDFEAACIGPTGENEMPYSMLNTSFGNSGGADDSALADAIIRAISEKPLAHCFDETKNITKHRIMSQIGG